MKTLPVLLMLLAGSLSTSALAGYKVGAMAKYQGTFQADGETKAKDFTLSFLLTKPDPRDNMGGFLPGIELSGSVAGVELPKQTVDVLLKEDFMRSGGVDFILDECSPMEKRVIAGKEIEVCAKAHEGYRMSFADVPFGLVEIGDRMSVFKGSVDAFLFLIYTLGDYLHLFNLHADEATMTKLLEAKFEMKLVDFSHGKD